MTRAALWLSWTTTALAAAASLVGLAVPHFYWRDPEFIAPQLLGQDAVTLVLAAPALAWSAWRAYKGASRAAIATAGLLLYMAYTYATYAAGVTFNALFLVYCAALATSTFGLFIVIPRLFAIATPETWERLPRRALIALMTGIALVFALLWGSDIVPALLSGEPPRAAVEAQTPTSLIHVLDLSFVLPLGAVAAALLARRRDAGIPLAGVFLVKAMAIALAVLSMGAFAYASGQPPNLPVAGAMLSVVVLVALVGSRYARALGGGRLVTPTRSARRGSGPARP